MGRNRFVKPEIVRLELSDGDWIDVKKRLTVKESRQAMNAVVGEVNTNTGWRKPNLEMAGIAEIYAYIVRWSFRDDADLPVPLSIDTIGGMEEDDFKEIEKAIEKHVKAMELERKAEKNARGGASKSEATSPSAA